MVLLENVWVCWKIIKLSINKVGGYGVYAGPNIQVGHAYKKKDFPTDDKGNCTSIDYTNVLSELDAINRCLQIAKANKETCINIRTDSNYAKEAICRYYYIWKEKFGLGM